MREFTDALGRTWTVSMNLATAQRIEGADFSAIYDGPIQLTNIKALDSAFFSEALVDTSVIGFILYLMVYRQVQEKGIEREDFYEGLEGRHLQEAKAIVWEEIAAFFPHLAKSLSALMEAYTRTSQKIDQAGIRGLKPILEELDQAMETAISTPGTMSGE